MKRQQKIAGIFSLLGIFFLIVSRETAIQGMQEGLKLCFQSVIPGLFPFFFLTGVMTDALGGQELFILKPLGKLMDLPAGSEALIIPAFLGGYPAGARAVSQYFEMGLLSEAQAKRMLFFCSNAGPAFFFGFLPAVFPEKWMVLSLWAIHVGTAILISLFLPADGQAAALPKTHPASLSSEMRSALNATAMVCGWILCFRILTEAAVKWFLWRLPAWGQALCIGLLELTNGCSALLKISSWEIRYILAAGLLGIGGLCITMQTASSLGRLPLRPYAKGKLLQSVLSVVFAISVVKGFFPVLLTSFLLAAVILKQKRKSGGKIPAIGV